MEKKLRKEVKYILRCQECEKRTDIDGRDSVTHKHTSCHMWCEVMSYSTCQTKTRMLGHSQHRNKIIFEMFYSMYSRQVYLSHVILQKMSSDSD